MLDAWLAGDVPPAVMADWCEERGALFPGKSPTHHRCRLRGRRRTRSSGRFESRSGSSADWEHEGANATYCSRSTTLERYDEPWSSSAGSESLLP